MILFKGWSGTKNFYPHIFLHFLTPLTLITYTTEEITGCTDEAVKVANKAPRNLASCFFISCFTASVTPSFNKPESYK